MTDQTKTIELNPDPLAEWEGILRTTGAWAHVEGQKGDRHYFIAKNPASQLAISLCAAQVKAINKLHRTNAQYKCLVCDLYLSAREEAQRVHHKVLTALIDKEDQTQTQKQGE